MKWSHKAFIKAAQLKFPEIVAFNTSEQSLRKLGEFLSDVLDDFPISWTTNALHYITLGDLAPFVTHWAVPERCIDLCHIPYSQLYSFALRELARPPFEAYAVDMPFGKAEILWDGALGKGYFAGGSNVESPDEIRGHMPKWAITDYLR